MENYGQVKKLQRIIVSCMLAFAVVLVVAIYSFIALGRARRENAKYDEFVAAMQVRQSDLQGKVDEVNSPEYLEERARDYLGMVKEGETLYKFK